MLIHASHPWISDGTFKSIIVGAVPPDVVAVHLTWISIVIELSHFHVRVSIGLADCGPTDVHHIRYLFSVQGDQKWSELAFFKRLLGIFRQFNIWSPFDALRKNKLLSHGAEFAGHFWTSDIYAYLK